MSRIDEEVKLMESFIDGKAVKFKEQYKGRFIQRPLSEVTEIVPNTKGNKLYHLSIDGSIPQFSFKKKAERMGYTEDHAIPKIYTGDTLMGCLMGMWDIRTIVLGSAINGKDEVGSFIGQDDEHVKKVNKGGQYIYAFDYDVALKPKREILEEVLVSNEHWLVPYKGQKHYDAKIIGKVFLDYSLLQNNHRLDRANYVSVIILELFEGMTLTDKVVLPKGHYRLSYGHNYMYDHEGFKTEVVNTPMNLNYLVDKIHLEKLSTKEYQEKKESIVPSLFMKKKLGLFTAW